VGASTEAVQLPGAGSGHRKRHKAAVPVVLHPGEGWGGLECVPPQEQESRPSTDRMDVGRV